MLFGALDCCAASCYRRLEEASQFVQGRAGATASQQETRWFGGLDGCSTKCCRSLEEVGCKDIAVQVSIEGVGDVPPLTLGDERVVSPQLVAPAAAEERAAKVAVARKRV
ncbi:unnamed protein product [Prorocentrum cordatum]|uniref:Uncharacterized protein n=1 Tax=Prorocentrum cordatum TaxID=2364126 RepID=A0ABN9WG53_9DINO|nr:unnamed protein product [Polarella glacialis]